MQDFIPGITNRDRDESADLKLGYKKSDNLLQLLHEQNVSRIPDVFLSVQLATTTTCRIYRRASTEECNPHICEDT